MQEAAIESESAFKTELESVRRLADLQKQSADTARARLRDVEASLEQIRDAACSVVYNAPKSNHYLNILIYAKIIFKYISLFFFT